MTRALIIVDVQHDFLPGGALGVTDGDVVIPAIEQAIEINDYDVIVTTQDWHPPDHVSFGDPPEYRDGSWPAHCVYGTHGAELHPRIEAIPVAARFAKGEGDVEQYSGFDGRTAPDAVHPERADLATYLRESGVTDVDVVGLATDYCVRATALDSQAQGFTTRVLLGAVRGVTPETTDAALAELALAGVEQVTPCPYCGAVENLRCCEFGRDR